MPDTLYLAWKETSTKREPSRPGDDDVPANVCPKRRRERWSDIPGRVVAFEPDAEIFTQYFFVAPQDFEAVGLRPEVARGDREAAGAGPGGACEECGFAATWLWFSRQQIWRAWMKWRK